MDPLPSELTVTCQTPAAKVVKQVERKYAFQEALNSAGDKLTVVDFSATWCESCKTRKPPFHPPSEKYSKAVFLDVKAHGVIVRMLLWSEVECTPTFRFVFFLFFFKISFSITNLPVLKKGQKMDEVFLELIREKLEATVNELF